MLLQGNLQEFSLPNIFQLVKMSAKSGSLTIRREGESGMIFFRNGMISYAYSSSAVAPARRAARQGRRHQQDAAEAGSRRAEEVPRRLPPRADPARAGAHRQADARAGGAGADPGHRLHLLQLDGRRVRVRRRGEPSGGGHPRRDERRDGHHGGLPPHRRVGAHLRAARVAGARAAPGLRRPRRRRRQHHAHRGGVARRGPHRRPRRHQHGPARLRPATASTAPRSSTASSPAASST